MDSQLSNIGILGGGTAGYLTALTLKKQFPKLGITIVESSKVPIIGVGEATIRSIVHFLHSELEIDIGEFYREVQPTWKLGIKFEWGLPGDYYFNFPFEKLDGCSAHFLTGDILNGCLYSRLMAEEKTFLVNHSDNINEHTVIANKARYAYHLDNELFVGFLRKKIRQAEIPIIDANIEHAITNPDDASIDQLVADNGEKFEFDFYFDCSGFRSLLMGEVLESPFLDYRDSLFTDRAIACSVPNKGIIKPYTRAITTVDGWLWNTPLRNSDHLGYVYSSSFCSDEEAMKNLKRMYPDLTNPRLVKYRSGRHHHFAKSNVIAIGNSYGFVEPLESTGIHMIIVGIKCAILGLQNGIPDTTEISRMNNVMNGKWDYLRWFLAIHFKFNKKLDSDFWQACREDVDISGFNELIELYRTSGPLAGQTGHVSKQILSHMEHHVFGRNAIDLILMGQGIVPEGITTEKRALANPWLLQKMSLWKELVDRALPQKEALAIIEHNPELLSP